jgi:energy-coupling factor transporter ATP-binding protein EcfA2
MPYPGLRPFEQYEADIFFGREEQTDELIRKLDTTRFLAVIGPSGCGKSSLVRAGMMAGLKTGYMARAGPEWRMAVMRPSSSPLDNLAAALLKEDALGPERCDTPEMAAIVAAILRRGPLGLAEVLRETPLPDGTNLLLLVDQFEEIFRFRQEDRAFEADAFVSLLLGSAARREERIYVVITMRSDYIGDCAVFSGLPEALNKSQYLTPRLTREQMRAAIVGPARVFDGDVDPALVNKLLNEVGRDPDQLPVLQHLLMRMWTYQRKTGGPCLAGTPVEAPAAELAAEPTGRRLTLDDYKVVGGLELALSNHANEAYEEVKAKLGERGQLIAEIMFRSLCVGGAGKRDSRRPTAVSEITSLAKAVIADADDNEVIAVANVFRAPQYGFLVPACPERLDRDRFLDITHESLIRLWDLLRGWVQKEADSVATYRSLEQAAQREKARKVGLYKSPDLDVALAWKAREKPVKEWAARYGGDFELAMGFLAESEAQRQEEVRKEKERQERELQQAQTLAEQAQALAEQAQTLAKERRRRIDEHATAARRLRWGVRALAVLGVLLAAFAVYARITRATAIRARQKAQEETDRADKELKRAENAEYEMRLEALRARELSLNSQSTLASLSESLTQYSSRQRSAQWQLWRGDALMQEGDYEEAAGTLRCTEVGP